MFISSVTTVTKNSLYRGVKYMGWENIYNFRPRVPPGHGKSWNLGRTFSMGLESHGK